MTDKLYNFVGIVVAYPTSKCTSRKLYLYLKDRNAFGNSLAQIVNFIEAGKDIKDILDLEYFCSEPALNAAYEGRKGFAAAFSAKRTASDDIIKHIQGNEHYKELIRYQELLLVAVNI